MTRCLVPALALAVLGACGGGSDRGAMPTMPTATTTPRPPGSPSTAVRGDIAINSITPAPGATVPVHDCMFTGANAPTLCTEQIRGTFDVVIDTDLTGAVLSVSFYGQARCGIAYSTRVPRVAAGTAIRLDTSVTSLSLQLEDGAVEQQCPLPVTTRRMVVQFWGNGNSAVPVLTREFDYAYTFVKQ